MIRSTIYRPGTGGEHVETETMRSLSDFITQEMLNDADESLFIDERRWVYLMGRRIVWDQYDRLEIDRYDTAAEAATRFDTFVAPDFLCDVSIQSGPNGGYWIQPGELGGSDCQLLHGWTGTYTHRTVAEAIEAIEAECKRVGIYPNVWHDFSCGRGTGWFLVDSDGSAIGASETLTYVH